MQYWTYCTIDLNFIQFNKKAIKVIFLRDEHTPKRLLQNVVRKCSRYPLNLSKRDKRMFKMNKCDKYFCSNKHLLKVRMSWAFTQISQMCWTFAETSQM